ncbi:MAG: PSP1 domain-containing protein [Candidatus Zipacnadales bacterium]
MEEVVGVCFKPAGKVYYFRARGLTLKPGEQVIAETSRGQELAEVVCTGLRSTRGKAKLKPILRRASEQDIQQGQDNRRRAEEARRVCQRLLKQMELSVKLVDVEYAFDASHITFSFASEDRIDFRDLQRRLKEIYDCEIEVRQIGVRDQAKILGGLGPCGRQLCCSTFLREFQPVTIRMAKDQDIALNPTKISGQCGRLMCCLRYEHESYKETQDAPVETDRKLVTEEEVRELSAEGDTLSEVMEGVSAVPKASSSPEGSVETPTELGVPQLTRRRTRPQTGATPHQAQPRERLRSSRSRRMRPRLVGAQVEGVSESKHPSASELRRQPADSTHQQVSSGRSGRRRRRRRPRCNRPQDTE